LGEFLFYFGKPDPFFHPLIPSSKPPPVSTQHSRKKFFAKLLGLFAVAGAAPKLLAKSASAAAPVSPASPFVVRNDTRTVARSGDSV
jgi:hypothetical protein